MSLLDDAVSPVVAFERTVEGQAYAANSGQCRKAIFHFAIKSGQSLGSVARALGINMQDVAIGSGNAEILLLEIAEGFAHQYRAGQQDH